MPDICDRPRGQAQGREALFRFSQILQTSETTDALLADALQTIVRTIPSDGAAVAVFDERRLKIHFRCVWFSGVHPRDRKIHGCYPLEKGLRDRLSGDVKRLPLFDIEQSMSCFRAFQFIAPVLVEKILAAPIFFENKAIGMLCAINDKDNGNEGLHTSNKKLLMSMAGFLSHPIAYDRIQADLETSLAYVRSVNEKKDRVISHLSHALKTPLAVLLASFELVRKSVTGSKKEQQEKLFQRIRRNLDRLLEIEYKVEDILQGKQVRIDTAIHMETADNLFKENDTQTDRKTTTNHFFREVSAAFLVHELKEPISVIETNSLMMMGKASDKADAPFSKAPLERVLRSTKKARNLLYSLLEVGRAESAVFACRAFSPVDCLRETLIDALESVDPDLFVSVKAIPTLDGQLASLAAEGIRIEVQASADAVEMTSDMEKYNQIIANLIRNALFYRRRRMLVLISLQHRNLNVAIRDDGPGIAPEHQERIFDRYKQIHASPDIARNGHGLGLGVSRILARAMGGDITIESQLGQGAVFRLVLPLLFRPTD